MDKSSDTPLVSDTRQGIPVTRSITVPSKFEPWLNLVLAIFDNRQLQILYCQIKSYFRPAILLLDISFSNAVLQV